MDTEFSKHEDEILLDTVYDLSTKGLYIGIDFWEKIKYKMNCIHNFESRSVHVWKKRFDYLYSLGPEMKSIEERYFDLCGRYYEDDYVPTLEEEIEIGIEEEQEYLSEYDE